MRMRISMGENEDEHGGPSASLAYSRAGEATCQAS